MLKIAGAFKLSYRKYLSSSMRCNINSFNSEQLTRTLQIFVDRLPGSALPGICSVLKNEVPSRYRYKLITELLSESDPSGLPGLHLLNTETLFQYIRSFKMKYIIYA